MIFETRKQLRRGSADLERGVSILETVVFIALFVAAIVTATRYLERAAQKRALEGNSTYQQYDLPEPTP